MRVAHVAALPFPTPQGTQALIAAMCAASLRAGHDTHLLCYPSGCGPTAPGLHVHRLPYGGRTTAGGPMPRSGPSIAKAWLDAGLAATLGPRLDAIAPDLVIAHHVEAALCCALVLGARPWVFCAHTSLRSELPTYFARAWAQSLAALGAGIERWIGRRATRSVCVSPLLSRLLAAELGTGVPGLPLPWPVPAPIAASERIAARAALGLPAAAHVVSYVGNLDAYQGLPVLVEALARLSAQDPGLRWLVATESGGKALDALLGTAPALRARTLVSPLADEAARRRVYAATSVVAVPRAAQGGIPIKLLDALARGVPVVATRSACAGLALDPVCRVVPDGAPAALAEALVRAALDDATRGPAFIARTCSEDGYLAALTALAEAAPFARHVRVGR